MKTDNKEPGWKTRELEEEYSKIAINFIDSLHAKNFLRLQFDSSDEHITKILLRLTSTNESFVKLFDTVSKLDRFPPFATAMNEFGFKEEDIMKIFMGLFAHVMFEEFEFLKTIMLMITEKKQYGIDKNGRPKAITGNETLGQILYKYDEIISDNRIQDNLNNDLRNVLGHGKWWIQNNKFCFENKRGVLEQYDLPQLLREAIHLSTFLMCFYNKGLARATQIKRNKT